MASLEKYPTEGARLLTELAALAPLIDPSINTAWLAAMSAGRWIALATAVQRLLLL